MRRAIRKHRRDFVAIIALVALATVVSGGILDKQRLTLPGWVPVLGQDFFEFEAEFSTAQAVTPGQGQTIHVAGVRVGDIASVRLEEGRAVVALRLDDPTVTVRRDARMLLRPKTGLKDMAIEMHPGSSGAAPIAEGDRIPIAQTEPDVNLDEILAALDSDVRTWVRVLAGEGAEGTRGRERDLGDALRRFEPLGRHVREVNEGLARRRRNIRRVVHNFSLLAGELGGKDDEIARLVSTSDAVLATLAEQEGSIRAALRELPGGLSATRSALEEAGRLGRALRPATAALRPAARALAPALRDVRPFLAETTPVLRDEIRPLARAALPVAREARPALRALAAAAPDVTESLRVVNRATDILAHNPPGEEEGFLFWMSWVNHLGASVFSTQDAHGPIRRGLILASCNTLNVLDDLAEANPAFGPVVSLFEPIRSSRACPQQTEQPERARGPIRAVPGGRVLPPRGEGVE